MAINLDIQTQLNILLAEQNRLLETSGKLAKDQVSLTNSLVTAMKSVNFKDVTKDVEDASVAVGKAAEATKGFGSTNQDVFDQVNATMKEAAKNEDIAGKGIDELGKKVKRFSVATAALDGFVQGLKFTGNMLHTVMGAGKGLVESLGHIGAAIISIPFKMLSGLIHMSDAGGENTELLQALEDIRKEFGSLKTTSGAAIVSMAKSMKGDLAGTGLQVTRIFGDLAERLKTLQEYAHNLGPLFAALAPQFMQNAEAVGAYYKGLGLTEEAQKAVATRSFALGTAITEELRQITNYSQQLSTAFNGAAGSAKEISRDMGTLMSDFKHFGGISTKEIGQAVVYFRRLGIEVSKVMGVIEKYDNFEDAANGAAQLSQAFGLNVDALQMMKAQNPAERVEMLRKSFFAAGRSVENMTRQERSLLAQQTGLDDSALDLAFSMKNQGMSYDQVTKKGDAAKKSQLTQTQALKSLADSIERLVKSGETGSGGFFDRFIQGFTVGIQRSNEFRKIMRELRVDLRIAYFEGIKVGRAFVDMFPGVKDVFKGIADMFEPRRFRAMFQKVTGSFKEFFKDMTDNPRAAMPRLLENLKKNFFSWFQGNSQNGRRILDGFKKFFLSLSDIAGGLLKTAMDGLKGGIKAITDLITGKTSLSGLASGANGALGFIGKLLSPIIEAIKEAGPSLWTAVKELFGVVWTKAQPWLRENFLKILGILTGPSLISMAGRIIVTSIAGVFASGLSSWVKGGGISKAFQGVKGSFASQVTQASSAAAQLPTPPASASGAGGAGGAVASTVGGAEQAAQAAANSKVNWGRALLQMAAITLFIVVGMAGVLFAIFKFAKAMQENKLTIESVLGASAAMVATATAMLAIAGAVRLLGGMDLSESNVGKVLVGLAIVGVVGALMAVGANALIESFGDIETSKITKTVAVMAGVGTFFLAAAAIAVIAGLVGVMATAGGGIGALVMAAGLAAIAVTTEVMVVQGMRIMNAIDKFQPGPGFTEKAKTFVAVMKGVGEFAGSIAQIVAATRPGLLSFTDGAAEQQQTLASVNEMILRLSNSIIRIVETVKTAISSMSGSERELRSAQSLGAILGSVAELGNALKPPTEALQESGWLSTLTFQGESVASKIASVSSFIVLVGPTLRSFIRLIAETLTGTLARGITPEQQRAAETIPAILKGVGQLAQSLKASSATILGLVGEEKQESVLRAVSKYMGMLLKNITESDLFAKITGVITAIATSVGKLNPSQVKAVQAIAPIVGPAFSVVAQIASIISSLAVPTPGSTVGNSGPIYQLIQLVNTFFERVRNDLPQLIQSMRTAFEGMTVADANKLASGMDGVSKIFQVMGTVPQMLNSMKGMGGGQNAVVSDRDIIRVFQMLAHALSWTAGTHEGGFLRVLRQSIPSLVEITRLIPNAASFGAKIQAIKAIFDVMASIPAMIQGLSELAGRGAGAVVPQDVLNAPLMSLNNILRSLASPGTSNGPNPLVGGRLQRMLSGVTGISDRQKTLITGTVDRVQEVSRALADLTGTSIADNSSGISEGISNINKSIFAFASQLTYEPGSLMSNITAIRPRVESLTSEIGRAQFGRVASVITGMVNEVNQLSTTIRGLQPIEIEQSLQRLGDTLGLGSDGDYRIENRNFTINLTVAVRLDADGLDALELSMIKRITPHKTRLKYSTLEK